MQTLPPLLVTAEEGRKLTGLSNGMWYRLVAEGQIPRLKIGRAARYRVADIEAFIARLVDGVIDGPAGR